MAGIKCDICPHKCSAYRDEFEGRGFCKSGILPKLARVAPHYWEEPCISGKNGSGAIFFSGCVMRCIFCQNHDISALNNGLTVSIQKLIESMKRLEEQHVHNINLVTPTHYVTALSEALKAYKPSVPVIYNCGGYESVSALKKLEGLVDVYLPDFKYADDALAKEYSGISGYFETAKAAIAEMLRQTGAPKFDDDGIILSGTIIRHLILPNHTKNSIAVLDCIKENFGEKAFVSLMAQYVPCGEAQNHKKLNRKITKGEYQKVLEHMLDLGLDGFAQERESAVKDYIPSFDLTGID